MINVQICPQCGSPALEEKESSLILGESAQAHCGHCGWSGLLEDAPAALGTGNYEGLEEMVMDITMTLLKTTAGPLCLVLERRGLLPPPLPKTDDFTAEQIKDFNDALNDVRGQVLRAVTETVVERGILICGENMARLQALDPRLPKAT
jgi:hypothetical protein